MLSPTEYALPIGSLILVTGASSYIATHIIDILLELGYNVRGTVRTEKVWLESFFDKKFGKGRFGTVIVPRMEEEGAYESCFNGVTGVVHVAADVSFRPDPRVVISTTARGCMNMLRAAQKFAVERVVLTSSSAAAITPKPGKVYTVDENTWNQEAAEKAWTSTDSVVEKSWNVYAASKTIAEQKAWEFMIYEPPRFVFNSVLTGFNVGEILMPETKGSVSMGGLRTLLNGETAILSQVLPQWFVDVRDTARLHVVALLDPEVRSQRLFAFAQPYSCTEVCQTLRRLRPDNKLIPHPVEGEARDVSNVPPSAKAERLIREFFGKERWTDIEESIEAGIKDLA